MLFRRLLGTGSEVGLFVYVAGLIPKPLGSSKGIDEPLGFDGLESPFKSFIEQTITRLGQDAVGKLVQVGGGEMVEDLVLGRLHHELPKVTHPALNGSRGGMVNARIKLTKHC